MTITTTDYEGRWSAVAKQIGHTHQDLSEKVVLAS